MIRKNEHTQKQLFGFSRPIKDLIAFSEDKPLHVYCKTLDAVILETNDLSAAMVAGRSRTEIIGKNYKDFIPEIDAQVQHNDYLAIKSNTIKLFIEYGLGKSFLSLKTQVRDSRNHISGIVGITFDLAHVSLLEIINILNQLDLTTAVSSSFSPSLIPFPHIIPNEPPLSEREKECTRYILKGMSAKEIGRIMDISYRTAESHIASIKNKLNCQTRSQLIEKISNFYNIFATPAHLC